MIRSTARKKPGKGYGHMQGPPDLLAATRRMDLEAIKACLEIDPECIHQTDAYENNAMHLCIAGGSFRVMEIMRFFVEETNINLLHKNRAGRHPLQLAIAMNDLEAAELLEEPFHQQLTDSTPDEGPELKPIP